ncbi:thiamine pyrophosphate-binding protein [Sulfodiicoccus acidiphilus]|uniref:2-oxoacid oxidoreductase (ferredoxin) n=1 Tax=Sulfodiicoccus acidiphilus TaxID=1670455 RepID=A0A348B1S8_9CREN|nr:thiamine pyrophosphate-binding protein [Sulfodiicoccus acidiphilus]BBD72130.1 thiamine pyrophosphate-binding protein [Sulfodiicoccus acidiphilus]GGT94765.1 thiamine pyrophosphate-binding protein [Sulfodiicoccus acidiphilus]
MVNNSKYSSDLLVDALKGMGIEYVSANIGSTFRALWESLVNYGDVELVPVPHEEIAVGIAHGYAKASGKPMVVLLHDVVGLLHGSMAIYNAFFDHVPILLIGAEGPMDYERRRAWIDYLHTATIPNEVVRGYVKWDDFPASLESALRSLIQGYRLSLTPPQGPVYVCLDAGYLERDATNVEMPKVKPPMNVGIDDDKLREVRDELRRAERPVIVAGNTGRRQGGVADLVRLAERIGAGVIDAGEYFSFPNSHPLDATGVEQVLREADLVLALDVSNLHNVLSRTDKLERKSQVLTKAKVVRIGVPSLSSWVNEESIALEDVYIVGEGSAAVRRLLSLTEDVRPKEEWAHRVAKLRDEERRRWREELERRFNDVPVSVPRLAQEAWEVLKNEDWVIANGDLGGWLRKTWVLERERCYLGKVRAGGLGYGLPISIGAALALRDKLVLDFQPDGDLLFTPSALWTARNRSVKLLIIMMNNRAYFNDADHNYLIAKQRGRDPERAFRVGGSISDPVVDFSTMAKSMGVHGVGPVESPGQLRSSIEEALEYVKKHNSPALVDVVTSYR